MKTSRRVGRPRGGFGRGRRGDLVTTGEKSLSLLLSESLEMEWRSREVADSGAEERGRKRFERGRKHVRRIVKMVGILDPRMRP